MQGPIISQMQKEEERSILKDLNSIRDIQLVQKLDFFATELLKVQDLDFLGKQLYRRIRNKLLSEISLQKTQDAYIVKELLKKIDSTHYCYKIFMPILRKYQSLHSQQISKHKPQYQQDDIDWTSRLAIDQISKSIKVQQNDEQYFKRSQLSQNKHYQQEKYEEQYNKLINSNVSYKEKLDIIQNYPVSQSRLQKYGQNKVKVTFQTDNDQTSVLQDKENTYQAKQIVQFKDTIQLGASNEDEEVKTSYKVNTRLLTKQSDQITPYLQKQVHYFDEGYNNQQQLPQNNAIVHNQLTQQQNSRLIMSHSIKSTQRSQVIQQMYDDVEQQSKISNQDQQAHEIEQSQQNLLYKHVIQKICFLKRKEVHIYLKMNQMIQRLNQAKQLQMEEQMNLNIKLDQVYDSIQQITRLQLDVRRQMIKRQYTAIRQKLVNQRCTLSSIVTLFQSIKEQHEYKQLSFEDRHVLLQAMKDNLDVTQNKGSESNIQNIKLGFLTQTISKTYKQTQQHNSSDDVSRALQALESQDIKL